MQTSSRWAPISASTDPAALVVASLAAAPDPSLGELLGAGRADALRTHLAERALAWARAHGPSLHAAVADGAAAVAALDGHAGPVLLVSADVPALDDRLSIRVDNNHRESAVRSQGMWLPIDQINRFVTSFVSMEMPLR